MVLDVKIRKRRDAQSCNRSGRKCGAIVRPEPTTLRVNTDRLGAIDEPPGFRSLYQRLMRDELLWRLRSTMLPNVVRTCDELSMNCSDTPRDQV